MDFQNPRHFALMALHMAGLPAEDMPDDFLSSSPDTGFDLNFALEHEQTLTLSWNEDANHWRISAQFTPTSSDTHWAPIVLELSQLLPDGLHVHTEAGCLNVCSVLSHENLTLDTLALRVVDVLTWVQHMADAIHSQPTVSTLKQDDVALQRWAIRG